MILAGFLTLYRGIVKENIFGDNSGIIFQEGQNGPVSSDYQTSCVNWPFGLREEVQY